MLERHSFYGTIQAERVICMQKIYAHRGAAGYAPENTLQAFALAAVQGADGVELDVQLSVDGEIVVIHDETVNRVSGGEGRVSMMTLAELKKLRVNGGWPATEKAEIPTLREVFEFLLPTGLGINVELKNTDEPYEGLEEKCIALAEKMGIAGRVLYSSFNHLSLQRVKAIEPSLPCGLLYDATMVRPWLYAQSLQVEALHPRFAQLFVPNFVQAAHGHSILVNPWTVDAPDDLRWVLETGADIVITNYPDRALQIRDQRAI